MLQQILERQKQFQKHFFNPDTLTVEEKVKWTKEFCLCAHQELAEVMDSIDWKSYHMYDKEYESKHVKTEIIDVLKFILNLAIVWGMTAEELNQMFHEKSDDVEARLKIKQQSNERKDL